MITVIDMASGELICSSTETKIESPATIRDELHMPALALQEVQYEEAVAHVMPPELVDIPAAAFLAKFEWFYSV